MDRLDDLIARLAPDQLEQLLHEASPRDLRPGEPIISSGDENGDFAVVVLTGGLKITMVSASGHEIILNDCGPGELVGEIAMLDSGPRTASVIAEVPSTVLLLPSHTFLAAVTEPSRWPRASHAHWRGWSIRRARTAACASIPTRATLAPSRASRGRMSAGCCRTGKRKA